MIEQKSEDAKVKKPSNGSIGSIFMHADRVDVFLMALGFLGAVVSCLTSRLQIIFAMRMFNNIAGLSKSSSDHVLIRHNLDENALAMVVYSAFPTFVASFIEGYCWTRTGERQASRLRCEYLKAVLRQDLAYFDMKGTTTSDVITSISNDSLLIEDVISEKIPDIVRKLSTFILNYAVAFILLWKLALVSLPLTLLMVVPGWLCRRSLIKLSAQIGRGNRQAGTIAEQAISSVRVVYAFVGERKTLDKFSSALERSMSVGVRQGLVKGLAIGSGASVLAIWSVLSFYGIKLVIYEGAQGGAVYFAGLSIICGGQALSGCWSHLKDITEACYVGNRIKKVMTRIPKIDSQDTKGTIFEIVLGKVEFSKVCFSYPSRPESVVLRDFSLVIPPGKTVALVGPSGSGKSTTFSLLQRFYNPLDGEILLDGVSIDKLQLKWLRSLMAMVSQEPSLVSDTIKENILFGDESATMDRILEASKLCDAHSFIAELPEGYETQVGERGVQLSGGQKQRIAIARAIIRRPKVLLLDEATSALDSKSEKVVQESIENLVFGRTTIIIAHRLSTVKSADIIAMVEKGAIVEIGSYQELMQRKDGAFKSLASHQQIEKTKKEEGCIDFGPFDPNTTKSDSIEIKEHEVAKIQDPKIPKPSYFILLAMGKGVWKQAAFGCLGSIVLGAIQPMYSYVMGVTVSVYYSNDPYKIRGVIGDLALCFFGLSVLSFATQVSQNYSFAYVGEYLTKRIREGMLSKILTFEVGWFDREENSSGVIFSRLTKDTTLVRFLVADKLPLIMEAIFVVVISGTFGLVLAWRLAIVCIAVQPLILACFYARLFTLTRFSRKSKAGEDESTKIAVEAVSNIRTITAFSSQDRISKLLMMAQRSARRESSQQSSFSGATLGLTTSLGALNWSLNFWYGGKLVMEGLLSPKAVFQTTIMLLSIYRFLVELGTSTTMISKASDATRSIFSLLDRDTRIKPDDNSNSTDDDFKGEIEFCGVYFSYPTRPEVMIFQDFSLLVGAGRSVALVGRSGSGKSTVVGLIERFYDPNRGAVKIDGRDVRSYKLRSLRSRIALVSQEPTLFSGTIRENIAYGSSSSSSSLEIEEAARSAGIHEFIMGQPDEYKTRCGDKGVMMSGGQKQRIAIARAVLRNPAVVLLDEATSALDGQSERAVQSVLERVFEGRTSVVVAHRISTVQGCDEIVVMEKGAVIEKGTHSSLMARGSAGAYHSFVSLSHATES